MAVLVDGSTVGAATYGSARADVCATYVSRVGCPNVGWTYNLNVASFSTGIHTLKIVATDTAGNVASSQVAFFATTLTTQTIAFAALGNQTLGVSPIVLSATATSGLPVTFVSNSPSVCSVAGNSLTLLTTGTCSITASQSGDSTYAAASSVTRTFTVAGLSTQTITFAPLMTQTLGTPPLLLSASASSGLAVTFVSNTPLVCTVSGTSVVLIAVGNCSITASQAGNASYAAATPVTQSFSVNSPVLVSQTITFAPIPNHLGSDAPFLISATASSGLPVTFSILNGPATISGSTLTISGLGMVVVQASQGGSNAYAPAMATQTFNVTLGHPAITSIKNAASLTAGPVSPVRSLLYLEVISLLAAHSATTQQRKLWPGRQSRL